MAADQLALARALRRHATDGKLSKEACEAMLLDLQQELSLTSSEMEEFWTLGVDLSEPVAVEDLYEAWVGELPPEDDEVLTKSAVKGTTGS
mmetsp:Transcript_21420/g.46678  ORF Transcript_21420/g.46678 Transcript_21420/m.46678 type:complete len:91 (-) Transcript_21420:162-434(-)